MRVYIADESPAVRSRVVRLLTEYEDVRVVGQTGDATQAVMDIRRLRPEVVILAIHMYMGSGIEVLKAVRHEQPAAVIIIMTNSANTQYRRECLRAGANYFLDKSIEFEKINTIIDRLRQIRRTPQGQSNQNHTDEHRHTDRRRAA